jgi:NADPH:quinone reductase
MNMKAVRFEEYGGPEVLEVVDVSEPSPGRGEVVVRVVASGLAR